MKFIDSKGKRGIPTRAPLAELTIPAKAFSASLRQQAKRLNKTEELYVHVHYDNALVIHTDGVIGDKIRLNAGNAKRLAQWILMNLK